MYDTVVEDNRASNKMFNFETSAKRGSFISLIDIFDITATCPDRCERSLRSTQNVYSIHYTLYSIIYHEIDRVVHFVRKKTKCYVIRIKINIKIIINNKIFIFLIVFTLILNTIRKIHSN